ncbi:MAG: potassium transporter Kup [Acidiphilium sp. 20-67-58]|uniref:potassium transporter Kup n=1 Tax=Acidiphilium sp. 20-67-58 TaxID=1970291 RepID=UPI000BCC81F8|nr:MAG: potassium transporter Kup [Acidiphilium sp. 20-67-58]
MSYNNATVSRRTTPALALAALGIVYGDLGTSPLYTMQTVVDDAGGHVDPHLALGILSLIFWTLVITISVKYCVFVMRADNHGEGGILALMSLIGRNSSETGRLLVYCGLFGAALIYGDGIITPAISVLSALGGVDVATNALDPYIMPLAVIILVSLFAAQHFGTASIGKFFGPVMLVWFIVIGLLGIIGVIHHPAVLEAINPYYAFSLLAAKGWASFVVLGGVFLAATGGEAMYADMGHLGCNPIRSSWFLIVLPACLLNYAGETALMFGPMKQGDNPFFLLVPGWALYPVVAISVVATIIASQAIITGSYSLTRQAMQLGWFPGLRIRQTSDTEYGQIYVPLVNWVMMTLTVLLTMTFQTSNRLAGAYGTAVSTTMLLTTALLYTVMRERWGWRSITAIPVAGLFLFVDLSFFTANLLKIKAGGWIPLTFGAIIFASMITWRRGTSLLREQLAKLTEKPGPFLQKLADGKISRVPGTAIFLSRTGAKVPPLMTRHVAQFGVLPEVAISLTIKFEEIPRIAPAERVQVEKVADGIWHLTVHFGFVEVPSLPLALREARTQGCPVDLDKALYFGARDDVVRAKFKNGLMIWQRLLFGFMYRNSVHTVDRFSLTPEQVVEIGRQIEI